MHVIVGLPSLTFNFWHGKPVFWCAFVWFLVALLATNIFPFKVVGKMTLTNNSIDYCMMLVPNGKTKRRTCFQHISWCAPVLLESWMWKLLYSSPMDELGCTPWKGVLHLPSQNLQWFIGASLDFWFIFQTSIFSAGTVWHFGGMKISPDSRKLNADEMWGSLDICRKTSKITESFKEFHHAKTLFYQDSYKHHVYDMKGCIFGWNMMKSQHSAIRYGQNDSLFHQVSILVVFDTNILPL